LLCLLSTVTWADDTNSGEIRATGSAAVYLMPDTAEINFAVKVEKEELMAAREEAAQRLQDIITAIKALNIEGLSLATDYIRVQPLLEPTDEEGRPMMGPGGMGPGGMGMMGVFRKVVAYGVDSSVSTTVRGEAERLKAATPKVIDAALGAGATSLHGPKFSKEDTTQAYREALENATRDAMANAQAIARGLGVTIRQCTYVSMQGPESYAFEDIAMLSGGSPSLPVEVKAIEIPAMVWLTARYQLATTQ